MKATLSPLQLKDIQIFKFKLEENIEGLNNFSIDIDFKPVLVDVDEEKLNGLLVEIKINNKARNTKLKLETKLLAVFEIDKNLDDERKARLLIYNGLSIVYGFIRGMVFQKCSYLSPQYRILPSINLADLIEKTIKEKIS
jgi:preprotein translocase subunit SecB